MKATIDSEGYLKIEVGSIVESMSEADLRTLAKYAVFQEVLLAGVVDMLVDGHMWNDDSEPAWWMGGDTFNNLRMKLVPLFPEVTAKAVQHLESEMRRARTEMATWRDACWKLQREWDEKQRPYEIKIQPWARTLSKEDARAYLTGIETKLIKATP